MPVGRTLDAEGWPARGGGTTASPKAGLEPEPRAGSCVVVLATDAPLLPHQLERLARRAGLGLARTGSTAGHGSGEIFLAFSTGYRIRRGPVDRSGRRTTHLHDEYLDRFFMAAVEATEEAVIDALFVADTVHGRDGRVGARAARRADARACSRRAGRLA